MDRKARQAELIFQTGLLLKPVLDIVRDPSKFDESERRHVRARFHVDHQQFSNDVNAFAKEDATAEYAVELHDIQSPLTRLNNLVRQKLVEDPSDMAEALDGHRQDLIKAIAAFPVTIETTIYDAKTPFTAYCRIRSLCETAKSRIIYTDRYLDDTLISRLLQHASPTVLVTVVTWPRGNLKNPKNYDAYLDISRLYAKERPSNYRLLMNLKVHDRWLVCDDQFYHLGGSVKDAADTCVFTVSRMDSSAANLAKVNDLINTATELFGPSSPVHP